MARRTVFPYPTSVAGVAGTCSEGPIAPDWVYDSHQLGIDIETDGLDPLVNTPIVLAVSNGYDAHLFPLLDMQNGDIRNLIQSIYQTEAILIGHNLAFDLMFLDSWFYVGYPDSSRLWDTMIAEIVLYAGLDPEFDLESTVAYYCAIQLDKSYQTSFTKDEPLSLEQKQYAVSDVLVLPTILEQQWRLLCDEDLLGTFDLEMSNVPVFADMAKTGIRVDQARHQKLMDEAEQRQTMLKNFLEDTLTKHVRWFRIAKQDRMQAKLDAWNDAYTEAAAIFTNQALQEHPDMDSKELKAWVKTKIKEWRTSHPRPLAPKLDTSFINLNSPEQMKAAFESLGIMLPSTNRATIATALTNTTDEKLIEIFDSLLQYKQVTKLRQAFGQTLVDRIGKDGRLHGNFLQIGTGTGRPSCSKPNLLQMPKRGKNKVFRKCFVPSDGCVFVRADYSQMELRLVAEMSGDTAMQKAFTDGLDLHTYTASLMFRTPFKEVTNDQRATAKTINFGILYGMGANKLRATLAVDGIRLTKDEAYNAVRLWKKTYPQAAAWIAREGDHALQYGYTKTPLGRKRYFHLPPKDEQAAFAIKREGANHPIQGGNADITKIALSLIFPKVKEIGGAIVLTVYDEILVEVPESFSDWTKQVVYTAMMAASQTVLKHVPSAVEVQVTTSWSEDDAVVEH